MGLSIAKYTQITFKNGRVQQSNFHDYKVLRIGEGAMDVRTHIVPATASMSRRAVLVSLAFRRLHRRSSTRSSQRPASASATCRSEIS